jgi:hypothetical protein
MSKKGRQTPTRSLILPYDRTDGQVAIDLYHKTNKTAQEWQSLILYDILAINKKFYESNYLPISNNLQMLIF